MGMYGKLNVSKPIKSTLLKRFSWRLKIKQMLKESIAKLAF
jgi:hypothetical protein